MPSHRTVAPQQNRLLSRLPAEVMGRIAGQLEGVPLALGDILFQPGTPAPYVYFPTEGILSLLYVTREGETAEIAVVGHDGLLGLAAILGGESLPSRTMVQIPGYAYRVEAGAVAREFARGEEFQRVTMRFAQVLLTQIAQTAVCNRHHKLESQLCRWLLMCMDRNGERHLALTQELIAVMLGVRREGVTVAAQKLQEAGIIRYARGMIEVLDRERLEQRACECYAVVRAESERLLPQPELAGCGAA